MHYIANIELKDGAQTTRDIRGVVGIQAAYRAAKAELREGETLRGVEEAAAYGTPALDEYLGALYR